MCLCSAMLAAFDCFLDIFILLYLEKLPPTIIWSISQFLRNSSQMAESLGAMFWFMGTLLSTIWLDVLKKKFLLMHMSGNPGNKITRRKHFSNFLTHAEIFLKSANIFRKTFRQFRETDVGNLKTLGQGSTCTDVTTRLGSFAPKHLCICLSETTLVSQILGMQKDPANKLNTFSNNYTWEILSYDTVSVHAFASARCILCKVHLNIPSSFFTAVSRLEILYPCFLRGNKDTDGTIVLLVS